MSKIPTYLIHGSLGSGKTTLLERLVQSKLFDKPVIIENEYANYNIDKDTLGEGKEIKVYDVSGGCICCSSGAELMEILETISKNSNIGTLFIETTGVASSVELVRQFMLAREFDENYQLMGNIYVIDTLDDQLDVVKQEKVIDIAMADVIVLNKTDLALEKVVNDLENYIKAISNAEVVTTSFSEVDATLIKRKESSKASKVLLEQINDIPLSVGEHAKDVLYQVIYPTKNIDESELISLIEELKRKEGVKLTRFKGVFTDTSGQKMSISGTRGHMSTEKARQDNINDVLVFIGNGVTKDSTSDIYNKLQ